MWKESKAKCPNRECATHILKSEARQERLAGEEEDGDAAVPEENDDQHQAQSKLNSRRTSQLQNVSPGAMWPHLSSQSDTGTPGPDSAWIQRHKRRAWPQKRTVCPSQGRNSLSSFLQTLSMEIGPQLSSQSQLVSTLCCVPYPCISSSSTNF